MVEREFVASHIRNSDVSFFFIPLVSGGSFLI